MIDQFTIDKIMDAASIVDVVSDYVTLKKRGVNYTGLCPFHDEKTPSFSVSPSKGICKCFSCGKGGNSVHFIMEQEQLSFYEALKFLAKKYNIEFTERELSAEEIQRKSERESMFLVNDFAHQWFQNQLHMTQEGQAIGLSYFRERGFRDDIIKKFQLGYSLEQRDALYKAATAKGYKLEYLEKTGLCISYDGGRVNDRFRGRVMFPIHTVSGKLAGFGGRILKNDVKAAKYQNSSESEIYHKSNELYGLFFAKGAISKHDRCYLVEGYTDVIAMHQAGIENVVASSGTALTSGQIRMIHRFTDNVTVLYDGDSAGIKASLRGIDLLLKEGMNIKVLLLPDGEDPDSFSRKMSSSDFSNYIDNNQEDFIHFKINLLMGEAKSDPIKRAEMARDIVESISLIPQQIIRSVYIKESSSLLGIDEKTIISEVSKRVEALRDTDSKIKRREQDRIHQTPTMRSVIQGEGATQSAPPITSEYYQHPTQGQSQQGTQVEDLLNYHSDTSLLIGSEPFNDGVQRSQFDEYEYAIIRLLVRYGNLEVNVASQGEDEIVLMLIEYADELVNAGEIIFENQLYSQIYSELSNNAHQENFDPSQLLLRHPNTLFSRLAVEVSADRHQLSKVHTRSQTVEREQDILRPSFERAVYDLLDERLFIQEKEIMDKLRHNLSLEEQTELMAQFADMKAQRKEFSKHRGERILIAKR
ncbi:MAG: DNA primase [Bacteroidales bacterium]